MKILMMNYSPKADKIGVNPDTVNTVSAHRVFNSWAHELNRLKLSGLISQISIPRPINYQNLEDKFLPRG